MTKKDRVLRLSQYLNELYPETECFLDSKSDYQFLIAVLLSAQATDRSVNSVTPILFGVYKDLISLSKAKVSDVYQIIKPVGLGASKAKNIVNLANKLIADFSGVVPETREQLVTLPGVGNKTAAVFLAEKKHGKFIPVDTHIKRICKRLGIATAKDTPDKIEATLEKLYEGDDHINFHRQIILFGRNICAANNKRKCEVCTLEFCKDRKK